MQDAPAPAPSAEADWRRDEAWRRPSRAPAVPDREARGPEAARRRLRSLDLTPAEARGAGCGDRVGAADEQLAEVRCAPETVLELC